MRYLGYALVGLIWLVLFVVAWLGVGLIRNDIKEGLWSGEADSSLREGIEKP